MFKAANNSENMKANQRNTLQSVDANTIDLAVLEYQTEDKSSNKLSQSNDMEVLDTELSTDDWSFLDLEEDTGFKIKPEVFLNTSSNVNENSLDESPRATDPTNDIKTEIEEDVNGVINVNPAIHSNSEYRCIEMH